MEAINMTYKVNEICGKGTYMMISVNDLLPNRFLPRDESDLSIDSLKDSIESFGIIEPLIVHKVGEKFEIICGERRFLAAKQSGITEVPAIVYDNIYDSIWILVLSCVENIERKSLDKNNIVASFIKLQESFTPPR